jgi:uncharacterized protein YegP (UPF0339 family)
MLGKKNKKMTSKFQKFQGSNGQYYFRLKAANGETILSSEGYTSEYNRNAGIESVKSNAPYDIRYKKSTSTAGQPYFNLLAANNQVIGTSEMYSSSASRDNGIEAVKKAAPTAIVE